MWVWGWISTQLDGFYCIFSVNVLMCGVLPLLQLFHCYFLYYVCGCYTVFYTFLFDCINLVPCTNLISLLTSIKFHSHLLFSSLPSIWTVELGLLNLTLSRLLCGLSLLSGLHCVLNVALFHICFEIIRPWKEGGRFHRSKVFLADSDLFRQHSHLMWVQQSSREGNGLRGNLFHVRYGNSSFIL